MIVTLTDGVTWLALGAGQAVILTLLGVLTWVLVALIATSRSRAEELPDDVGISLVADATVEVGPTPSTRASPASSARCPTDH